MGIYWGHITWAVNGDITAWALNGDTINTWALNGSPRHGNASRVKYIDLDLHLRSHRS